MDFNLSVNQETLPVQIHSGSRGQVLVNACGKTVKIEMKCAQSMLDLQKALQLQLQMEAQTFNFFDVNGKTLSTDSDLIDAVAEGQIPICATLTDASIHFIENRREELAQMQWKLVRDSMTAVDGKMAAVARQATETQHQLEQSKQEFTSLTNRLHEEAVGAVHAEREVAHNEVQQLSERVTALAQMLHSERQSRDLAVQSLEQQLASVRDMFDRERHTYTQEFALQVSMFQEVKAQLECEKSEREALKDKHLFDIHTVVDKVEAHQSHITNILQDHHHEVAKVSESWHNKFQRQACEINRIRADVEDTAQEAKVRCLRVEESCAALDTRIVELSNRQATRVDRLMERHERVSQAVDTLKLESKKNKDHTQIALARLRDFQNSLEETEGATQKLVLQERQGRDDQLRCAQMALQSESKRQIAELEEKLSDRFERESCERERNTQQIIEEVVKKSPTPVMHARTLSGVPASPPAASKMEVKSNPCWAPSIMHNAMSTMGQPPPSMSPSMVHRTTSVTPTCSPTLSTRSVSQSRITLPGSAILGRSSSSKRL
mmetsp:Transcript_88715/g.153526  ORF Transcript_88715/g.153526 Transcript_88715/m.153526 type:complete len:550 (-) Transcript_88715:96-1745(-)